MIISKLENEIELIYGKSLTKTNRKRGDIPVYGSNGIVDFHNKYIFKAPGLIIGRKGTVGMIKYSYVDFWAIDTTYVVNLKRKDDSLLYWYYFLKTVGLKKMNTHSAVPGLNRNAVYMKKVKIFEDVLERKRVANYLAKIDDKIEINNKINKTLENMAQTIFKHWFIDFEFPDENGQPYKSSGGKMIESELGLIPEGWEVIPLNNIIKISSGKRPKKRSKILENECKYKLVGASSVMGYTINYNFDEPILVIGRVGTHGVVQKFSNKVWASDNTLVIRTGYYEYVNQVLNQIDYNVLNRGSTQPLITQTDIKNISIVLPSSKFLNKYEIIMSKNYNLILNNLYQNEMLEDLKNLLLPKLMSGEIRVPLEDK